MLIELCKVGDLEPGKARPIKMEGRWPLAVYNLDGEYFCTDDMCTHAAISLTELGEIIEDDQIECPAHWGAFDIRTGKATVAPCAVDLRTYPVVVKDGIVYAELTEEEAAGGRAKEEGKSPAKSEESAEAPATSPATLEADAESAPAGAAQETVSEGANFTISLAGSDENYICAADDTILLSALRADQAFPYECNVGSCGTCRYELVEGEVETLWEDAPGLSERDRSRGRRLACQSRPTSDCVVKVRLDPNCQPKVTPRKFPAKLVKTVKLTSDITEFHFVDEENKSLFLPGQYALLYMPGINGVRAYSMSNIANNDGEWQFQIKRVPNGAGTAYLFGDTGFKVGDLLTLDGPYGMAYLREDAPRDIVCIAGGSGLAPMVSIARGMSVEPKLADHKLLFFYGGRGPDDICGEEMLQELPGYGTQIKYYPCISMPELDTAKKWKGAVGFVHELVKSTITKDYTNYEYYLAGPPPMVDAIHKLLAEEWGVPPAQIHYDSFY